MCLGESKSSEQDHKLEFITPKTSKVEGEDVDEANR
jgi:hypothetical protein